MMNSNKDIHIHINNQCIDGDSIEEIIAVSLYVVKLLVSLLGNSILLLLSIGKDDVVVAQQ